MSNFKHFGTLAETATAHAVKMKPFRIHGLNVYTLKDHPGMISIAPVNCNMEQQIFLTLPTETIIEIAQWMQERQGETE